MNKFEQYLIDYGIHFQVAGRYGRVADMYLEWLKKNNLKPRQITKRSQFNEWLQECREQGNGERTIQIKENVIKHYYYFLGTKNNPALSWVKKKKKHTLPPAPLKKEELVNMYNNYAPNSPADHRNRCMLGFVLFQGLKRAELQELRISDIDFEKATVFVIGQRRSNSRTLKLEPFQMLHLYDYLNKYRKDLLVGKKDKETDRFFLSKGAGNRLSNTIARMSNELKKYFPQVEGLLHIRGSVITHWQKEEGIMEAMEKAGHRYVSSTQRYETSKYEELHEQLKSIHPLEHLNLSTNFTNH